MLTAKKILDKVGVGGDRLDMYNISAAMGPQFAKIATDMTERVREMGPNPLKAKRAGKAEANVEVEETAPA